MSQKFHLGDVLSVTTGRLVSTEGISGVYRILNYLTGEELFTHQLPRASGPCREHILQAYPILAEVQDPNPLPGDKGGWMDWVRSLEPTYGEYLELEPLPGDTFEHKNPLQELTEMVGEDRVIVVDV